VTDEFIFLGEDCQFEMLDFSSGLDYFDNCTDNSGITITQNPIPGTIITQDTVITVITTLVDQLLNQSTCEFQLTIIDGNDPIIACVDSIFLEVDDDCKYEVPSFEELVTFYDNCSEFSFVQTPEIGTILYSDSLASLTVTDSEGNFTVCEFEIALQSTLPPLVSCPPNISADIT